MKQFFKHIVDNPKTSAMGILSIISGITAIVTKQNYEIGVPAIVAGIAALFAADAKTPPSAPAA